MNYLKNIWNFARNNKFVLIIALSLIGYLFVFSCIYSNYILQSRPDGLYAGPHIWGDLPWHMSLASSFAERGISNTLHNNPIFSGTTVSYPFMADLITGFLIWFGISERNAFIWPSLLCLILFICSLYWVTYKITRSKIGTVFIPFLFFFNGSLWGLNYLYSDFRKSNDGLMHFVNYSIRDYSYLTNEINVHFSNILAQYILPQRAFIFGLLLGIFALYFMWRYWTTRDNKDLLRSSVFLALLPLVHTHSYVALIIVFLSLAIGECLSELRTHGYHALKKRLFVWLAYFIVPLAVLSVPQIYAIYPQDKVSSLRLVFGWYAGNENIIFFWVKNFLPHIFVVIAGYILAPRKLKTFFNAFIVLFVLMNVVVFQPNIFDNGKFLLWIFLAGLILVSVFFGELYRESKVKGTILIVTFTLSMTLVGVIELMRESHMVARLFTQSDVTFAKFVKDSTDKNAVFLTGTQHNNPVVALGGRGIVYGYPGWVWSHGLDGTQRMKDIMTIYGGGRDALDLIKKYDVEYIVVDKTVLDQFKPNLMFLNTSFTKIYSSDHVNLYDVRKQ